VALFFERVGEPIERGVNVSVFRIAIDEVAELLRGFFVIARLDQIAPFAEHLRRRRVGLRGLHEAIEFSDVWIVCARALRTDKAKRNNADEQEQEAATRDPTIK